MAHDIRALTFDIFGTVVDWYGSIAAEVTRLALPTEGGRFALDWRAGYQPAMQEVRSGTLPWTNIDGLHRRILDRVLAAHRITLPEAEVSALNHIWHRLDPWPDSARGLALLKQRFVTATLSNGNLSLLVDLARHGGLPFDCVLSAELFAHYKPDPEVYLGAARLLDLAPAQVMMVAAHSSDLRAAAACGLRTAYVMRPAEKGPGGAMEPSQPGEFSFTAFDFVDLARQLGC